jgi:hypothetical protein
MCPEGFTVAAVGDIILTRPIHAQLQRQSPELLALLQQADLVVGNFESTLLDLDRFEGHPSAESGFGWLNSPPAVAPDLREIGFDRWRAPTTTPPTGPGRPAHDRPACCAPPAWAAPAPAPA